MARFTILAGLLAMLIAGRAFAAAPRVVASIKPIHALVAGVMDGVGVPALLVEGSASPHSYALRPTAAKTLSEADVVFWIGPELETTLEKPLVSLSAKAHVIGLLRADGVKALRGVSAETVDGHIWLDVENARAMVTAIAETLSKADASHAQSYARNAADVKAKLAALDENLRVILAPAQSRPFIVFHDAYRYFTNRYGLNMLASVTINPDQPPGARHVAELKAIIARNTSICVFVEPQFQPKLMSIFHESANARVGVLDPEGSALPPGSALYTDLMQGIADNLVRCLSVP